MDLIIPQGTDWAIGFPVRTVAGASFDLTGWSLHAQVRAYRLRPGSALLFEWSTGVGPDDRSADRGVAELADGFAVLRVRREDSALWRWSLGDYDLVLFDPQNRGSRPLQGRVLVSATVTREDAE